MDEIEELRKKIGEIDAGLINKLAERFAVTDEIGRIKATNGIPTVDNAREESHLKEIRLLASDAAVNPDLAGDILKLVIAESVKRQYIL